MYFDDGTNPTLSMTRDFIALAERVFATGGAVAVHCKAGLGRTGTLIGAWLIYKHGFTASEGSLFYISSVPLKRFLTVTSCSDWFHEIDETWIMCRTSTTLPLRKPNDLHSLGSSR